MRGSGISVLVLRQDDDDDGLFIFMQPLFYNSIGTSQVLNIHTAIIENKRLLYKTNFCQSKSTLANQKEKRNLKIGNL